MKFIQSPLIMVRENSIQTDYFEQMKADNTLNLIRVYENKIKYMENHDFLVIEEIEKFIEHYWKIDINICKKFLGLKRDVFNKRINRIVKYSELVKEFVVLAKTINYINISKEVVKMEKEIQIVFEQETSKCRDVLQKIWLDEDDLKGCLIHFDESIGLKLEKYLNVKSQNHTKRLAKLDYTLLKIYTRAALKPSPFSTLCSVEIKTLDAKNNFSSKSKVKKININYVHIYRIWEYISEKYNVAKRLKYKINFSILKDDEGYTVSRTIDSPDLNAKVYNGRPMLYRLPNSNYMDKIYKLRKEKKRTFSYGELANHLEFEATDEEFHKIFMLIREKALIYCVNKPKENSFHIIDDFIASLNEWGLEDVDEIKELTKTLSIIGYYIKKLENDSNYNERKVAYEEIKNKFDLLYKKYNHSKWCDKNILYEDYIVQEINKSDRQLTDQENNILHLISELNLLFDVNVRTQTEFGEKFINKYKTNKVHTSNSTIINDIIASSQSYNYLWKNNMIGNNGQNRKGINYVLDELKKQVIDYISHEISKGKEEEICLDITKLNNIVNSIPNVVINRTK